MGKTLMILEVSRKQDYIFSSNKLKDNVTRSREINDVTQSAFFRKAAGEHYCEERNMVYSGGGHTVLQFDAPEQAVAFAQSVTEAALRRYRGMEVFVKALAYDENLSPGKNLIALSAALERKKALRKPSFRQLSMGIEALNENSYAPKAVDTDKDSSREQGTELKPPAGYAFPNEFEKLAESDNFIAVVHIDGNGMGKRVSDLYDSSTADWDACCAALRRFSEGVSDDFTAAFSETAEELILLAPEKVSDGVLPIRPVILAGDDVCFVTAGRLGTECARIFLEKLSRKTNAQDGKRYAACAGVAIVHKKYPFHQAYDLAEELCSSAKRYGSQLDPENGVSAMDWHIEFGQLKGSLRALREEYITDDGKQLLLRPAAVLVPENRRADTVRTYDFFRAMCRSMKGEYGKIARSKIKELRTALKQGEVETRFFMQDKEIGDLLYHSFTAMYRTIGEQMEQYRSLLQGGKVKKPLFVESGDGMERCLFFDAIEMIDHCDFLEEVDK